MQTLTRNDRSDTEQETVFRCANREHWRLASARERMRIHDRRWENPPGRVWQHDHCGHPCKTAHPLRVEGRLAFCPLGDTAEDHRWIAAPRGFVPSAM